MNKSTLIISTIALMLVSILGLACTSAWANDTKTIELDRDGEVILSIPLDPAASVQIDAISGNLKATTTSEFSCGAEVGSCEDVQVSMSGSDGSFTRSPSTVSQGSSVTFNWSARGAWECEGIGLPGTSWANGVKLPRGPQSVAMNVSPGTYEASIRCSNGPNEALKGPLTITVTAPDAGIPQACLGRQPGGMQRTSVCVVTSSGPGSANCNQYDAVYGGQFPGVGQARQLFTERNQYIAMQFTMPNLPSGSQGGWSWIVPQYTPTFTGRNIQSISKCPGDFDPVKIEQEMGPNCYMKQGALPPASILWAMANGNSNGRCQLEPGETYYYNIVYSSSDAGTPPSDINWQCGTDPSVNVCSNNTQRIY